MNQLEKLQKKVYDINKANGWFDDERSFGDDIALLHSEVSEAFEAYRDLGFESHYTEVLSADLKPVIKPEGVSSEFADILVRLLDSCERHGVDLTAAVEEKLAFNATRGYKHGGKKV